MAKIFAEKAKNIQVQLIDIKGNKYDFTVNMISVGTVEKIENMLNEENVPWSTKLKEQLKLLFPDREIGFWDNFSSELLGDMVMYIVGEAKKKDA